MQEFHLITFGFTHRSPGMPEHHFGSVKKHDYSYRAESLKDEDEEADDDDTDSESILEFGEVLIESGNLGIARPPRGFSFKPFYRLAPSSSKPNRQCFKNHVKSFHWK